MGVRTLFVRSLEQRTKSPRSPSKRDTGCQPVDSGKPNYFWEKLISFARICIQVAAK